MKGFGLPGSPSITQMDKSPRPGAGDQRGLIHDSGEPRFLVIGRIVKPHGVDGEVRVAIHTDVPERFNWLERVFVGQAKPVLYRVEGVRFHQASVLMKLEGIHNRDDAQLLSSQWVQVPEAEGIPLEEGEYFLYQAIGLKVNTDEGKNLGEVTEIIVTGANNVFVVHGPQGEVLLPDTDEVVLKVDIEGGQMLVHLLEGLIE
jgi:16S rRNA processing protein RimM